MGRIANLGAGFRRTLRAPVGLAARYVIPRIARSPRHELAIGAIFRQEAPFLDEWLSFHAGVGATHFYLYNNFSTDHFREVLAPWIARGAVTLVDWPVTLGQIPAYKDCIARARGECRWLALIDIDEFLFSPRSVDIRGILRSYSDLPGVEVWQVLFGSSGHATRPALPVTEAYLMRASTARTTVKSVANPRLVYRPDVHQHKYWYGVALDPSRRQVANPHRPTLDILRINHYWSRSLEDMETKVARGYPVPMPPRDRAGFFAFERELNAEKDEVILPIARAIRQAGAQQAPQAMSD